MPKSWSNPCGRKSHQVGRRASVACSPTNTHETRVRSYGKGCVGRMGMPV